MLGLCFRHLLLTLMFCALQAVAASPVEREQLSNLTEQEKQWIAANPSIRVGNELRWAPFNYHEDGIAKGFSVDYIKLLAAKVGLNVTFIAPSRFDVLLEQTKNTELDVLTDAIRTEEREALLSFSSPYFENKNVIVSLVKRPYTSIKQLEHRKVAVTGGNFLSESSAPSTPWTIESVKHPQEAIQALLDGRVDAALGQHAVMRHSINQLNANPVLLLTDIDNAAAEGSFFRFAVPRQSALLLSILNKAIADVTPAEHANLLLKWLDYVEPARTAVVPPSDDMLLDNWYLWMGIACCLLVVPILGVLALGITKRQWFQRLATTPTKLRIIVVVLASGYLLAVLVVAWASLAQLEKETRQRIAETLVSMNASMENALRQWGITTQREVTALANKPLLSDAVFTDAATNRTFIEAFEITYRPVLSSLNAEDIALLGLDGEVITSLTGKTPSLQMANTPWQTVLDSDSTLYLPPQPSSTPSHSDLFFFVHKINGAHHTPFYFVATFSSSRVFEPFATLIQFDVSSETYVVGADGRMLSQSRFVETLAALSSRYPAFASKAGWFIRDPGQNIVMDPISADTLAERPLTLMAADIQRKNSGFSSEGYRDYRGIVVLGAWMWSELLQVGIATEVDEKNALGAFYRIRWVVIGTLLSIAVITLMLVLMVLWMGERISKHLKREVALSHQHLSNTLAELQHAEALRTLALEGAETGLWHVNVEQHRWWWDERAAIMLGIPSSSASREALARHIHPNEQAHLWQRFVNALSGENSLDVEFSVYHNNDPRQKRFLRARGKATQDAQQRRVDGVISDITALKSAQRAVREMKEYNQLILNSAGDGIIGTDIQGRITFCNRKASQLLHYTEGELVGSHLHPLLQHSHADGSDYPVDASPMTKAALDNQQYMVANEVLWRKDGEKLPVEYTAVPLHEGEQVVGTVVVFRDITERLAQAQRLEQREKQVTTILEASPDPLIIVDKQGQIFTINQRTEEVFGYTRDELIGQPIEILLPERYRQGHVAMRNGFMQAPVARTFSVTTKQQQFWAITKAGLEFPIELSLNPVMTDQGMMVVSAVHDISERLAAEAAIRESEERLHAAAVAAELVLWEYRPKSNDVFTNQHWAELLHYGVEQWLSVADTGKGRWFSLKGGMTSWRELIHSDDKERVVAQFVDMIKGATNNVKCRYRLRCGNGHWKWVMVSGQVIEQDENGLAERILGVMTDINEEMLLQHQLIEARDEAESATKTKSAFLATMSHEIRTPMNAIIGMSHLALNTALNPKQQSYIEKVKTAAESLLGIINDILDFSKIEAGRLKLEHVPFELENVLESVATLTSFKAEEKGLELLFNIDAETPLALIGDPLRLGQVLTNLIGNAIKFTQRGEIVVTVQPTRTASSDTHIRFSVSDTGIGMTEVQQGALFKPFSQADSSTTRKFGGTGLGLAISKTLVELMGGHITVRSEVGQGSEFSFVVPLARQRSPQPQPTRSMSTLQHRRVLVVDDNHTAGEILAVMLHNIGFSVTYVASAAEALIKLKHVDTPQAFDLVMVDWKMPEMTGIEMIRAMKELPLYHELPKVVMVTAYGRDDAMHAAQGLEVCSFLTKPVTPSSLLDAVMLALGNDVIARSLSQPKNISAERAITHLKGAHILLVEDNKVNQELATELLESNGLQVTLCENGQQAVDILRKGAEFDGVLMDCNMPVMDGYTATLRIREMPEHHALPIIAMTANALTTDKEQALAAGMNDHIPKPIDIDEMFTTMAKWVTPRQPMPPGEETSAPQSALTLENDVALPLDIAGIDIVAGLARAQGNSVLYRKLLRSAHEAIEALSPNLSAESEETLRFALHTLRGLAGNIGANRLADACQRLEHAIVTQQPSPQATALFWQELDIISNSLARFHASMRTPTASVATGAPITPEMVGQCLSVLATLAQMTLGYDAEASEYLTQHQSVLAQVCGHESEISQLLGALSRYDFEQAAVLIEQLQQRCEEFVHEH